MALNQVTPAQRPLPHLRLLGRGGFGFVYQAQDTLLAEEVAIKELIPALVGDEAMLKRFLAEAKATMRLTPQAHCAHPQRLPGGRATTTSSWSTCPAARWRSGCGSGPPAGGRGGAGGGRGV